MKMRFFDLAKKISAKSDHPQHKIGGVLTKKNRIISIGFNKNSTHSKSNHPFKNRHCELDCILGINEQDLNGATIYLFRQTKSGQLALSRPCKWCYELLKKVGVRTICYTDYGNFKKEEIA